MNNMIQGEANIIIDILKEVQKGYSESDEGYPFPEWYALSKAIQAIRHITWIPVKDKLPEYGVYVLTCSADGSVEIQSLEYSSYYYWKNRKGDCIDFDEVIAWMPSPVSYVKQIERIIA